MILYLSLRGEIFNPEVYPNRKHIMPSLAYISVKGQQIPYGYIYVGY
jgi:hypothetical protein